MRRIGFVMSSMLAAAFAIGAQESSPDGKMLFLHLLQKNGKITVVDAKVVAGSPRERFPESGSRWELVSRDGITTGVGTMPAPVPTHFDFKDTSGALKGGIISKDSIHFFARVPYTEGDERINFYKAGAEGLSKSAAGSAAIGSCMLREVLK